MVEINIGGVLGSVVDLRSRELTAAGEHAGVSCGLDIDFGIAHQHGFARIFPSQEVLKDRVGSERIGFFRLESCCRRRSRENVLPRPVLRVSERSF